MSETYYCSRCKKETTPELTAVGAASGCCEEAELEVAFCPSYPDKCAGCERRPLTEAERDELTAELAEERDQEMTPTMRVQERWRNGA